MMNEDGENNDNGSYMIEGKSEQEESVQLSNTVTPEDERSETTSPMEGMKDVKKASTADSVSNVNEKGELLQSYSCSRCRRLKKKCLRQMPSCSNCVTSHYECVYIGRLPRRSKKQIEAAMINEKENTKRRYISKYNERKISVAKEPMVTKKVSGGIKKGGSPPNTLDNASLSAAANNLIPNTSEQNVSQLPIGLNVPSQIFTPASMTDGILDSGLKSIPGTNLPQNMEGVSSLISALNSDFEAKKPPHPVTSSNLPNSGVNNLRSASNLGSLGNLDEANNNNLTMSLFPKYQKPNSSLLLDQFSPMQMPSLSGMLPPAKENENPNATLPPSFPKPITNVSSSTMKLQTSKISNVGNSSSEDKTTHYGIELFDSIPIIDSAIQLETVSSVFHGAKDTPWTVEDNKFKAIDRSLYDRFIAGYFNHNHRTFPMIDKTQFLNNVSTIRDFTQMDGSYSETFIFKLNMIMAIGCTTLQRAGMLSKNQEILSEHFAYLAMKNFSPVVKLQNIDTVICLLLLGVYSFFEPKGVSSWTISGIIMRLSVALGLNRKLSKRKLRTMLPSNVECRNRIFWSAYCYERLVSTSLGRISAISDDSINVPLPQALHEDEESDIEVTLMTITLRRLSGRIYEKVHSVSATKHNYTPEEKMQLIADLRKEIDDTYATQRSKMQNKKTANYSMAYFNSEIIGDNHDMISFNSSDIWLAMRHSQFQIMLYRPSALIPKPPLESLTVLGEFCLKALRFTYTLYKKKMLPLNWITLFRALTICNTMLYCLCQWSIDITESKKEIQQCVDILQHFSEKWVFAKKCADVFQNISNTIVDISLSNGQIPNMDNLTRELFGASDEYKDILDENNVDIVWDDKFSE